MTNWLIALGVCNLYIYHYKHFNVDIWSRHNVYSDSRFINYKGVRVARINSINYKLYWINPRISLKLKKEIIEHLRKAMKESSKAYAESRKEYTEAREIEKRIRDAGN